jgi:hypothetical protein
MHPTDVARIYSLAPLMIFLDHDTSYKNNEIFSCIAITNKYSIVSNSISLYKGYVHLLH